MKVITWPTGFLFVEKQFGIHENNIQINISLIRAKESGSGYVVFPTLSFFLPAFRIVCGRFRQGNPQGFQVFFQGVS